MQYQQKLDDIERRFEELTAQMADPAVISDSDAYRKISKQQSDLSDSGRQVSRVEEAVDQNLQEARGRCWQRPTRDCAPWRRTRSRAWSRS